MFPQALRLRKNNQILLVFRKGEKVRRGLLTLYFLPSQQPLVTVIVDTKVSKSAVVRNRIKRQIRAVLQEQTLPQGMLIARAYPGQEKLTFLELQAQIIQCLKNPVFHHAKHS